MSSWRCHWPGATWTGARQAVPSKAKAGAWSWVRTVARSRDRALLLRCLARGLRDGVTTAPRANVRSLAGLGPTTTAVERAEAARAGVRRA